MCMKTRCELQEDPSKNDEVQVHFFSCVELTFFYNCFSCRNDNSEFIKVLLTINRYCFNKKKTHFPVPLSFLPYLLSSRAIFLPPKFRFSPRHDLPAITPQRIVD